MSSFLSDNFQIIVKAAITIIPTIIVFIGGRYLHSDTMPSRKYGKQYFLIFIISWICGSGFAIIAFVLLNITNSITGQYIIIFLEPAVNFFMIFLFSKRETWKNIIDNEVKNDIKFTSALLIIFAWSEMVVGANSLNNIEIKNNGFRFTDLLSYATAFVIIILIYEIIGGVLIIISLRNNKIVKYSHVRITYKDGKKEIIEYNKRGQNRDLLIFEKSDFDNKKGEQNYTRYEIKKSEVSKLVYFKINLVDNAVENLGEKNDRGKVPGTD